MKSALIVLAALAALGSFLILRKNVVSLAEFLLGVGLAFVAVAMAWAIVT